ncbi:MAG: hypothetical protein WA005_10220 [Candidatus Binataceae bacterium]
MWDAPLRVLGSTSLSAICGEGADDLASRLVGWRSNLAAWKERVMPLARELRAHTWSPMAERIVSIAGDRQELAAEDLGT